MSRYSRSPVPFAPAGQGPSGPVRPIRFPRPHQSRKHPLDFCRPLYKRRWLGVATFGVVLATVAFYVSTEVPQYKAGVELLIQSESPKILAFKEVTEQGREAVDFYQTQFRLIQSRTLAKRTLDELQLWRHPDFGGPRPARAGRPS
jgi:uncharacterized protein involved in exopolysaccharide biosynthesis